MANNPYEPHADARVMAGFNWQTYQSHLQAGFSPEQALQVVLTIISTSIAAGIEQQRREGDN